MRPRRLLLVAAALLSLAHVGGASAKTTFDIYPRAGPPGATIHVHGSSFGGDAVNVGMLTYLTLESLPKNGEGLLLNPLPEQHFALLATVVPKDGEFDAAVTLSPQLIATHGYSNQVDIVAEEPARGLTFVASQTFTFTTALAPTGTGSEKPTDLPVTTLFAALASAGALVMAAGWRMKRVR